MSDSIPQKIECFKADLQTKSVETVLRKHVLFGECHSLTCNLYYELKQEIADNFSLYPNEIVMVGSGKLGFSISEKPAKLEKPAKPRYREFGDDSDYDMAIVSTSLFDKIWQEVFRFKKSKPIWENENKFKSYLFNGWIRPDKLPYEFELRKEWFEFFNAITSSRKYGGIAVTAGLYKNWNFLEDYQMKAINDCKKPKN